MIDESKDVEDNQIYGQNQLTQEEEDMLNRSVLVEYDEMQRVETIQIDQGYQPQETNTDTSPLTTLTETEPYTTKRTDDTGVISEDQDVDQDVSVENAEEHHGTEIDNIDDLVKEYN